MNGDKHHCDKHHCDKHPGDKHLIACPIFEDELELALPSYPDVIVHFMNHGVHNDPDRMLAELQRTAAEAPGGEISLLVGRECYCAVGIDQYAKSIGAKYPQEKNCIEIILGPEKTNEMQRDRTTIHTRGWMRMIRRAIAEEPLNEDSIRLMSGYFERLILLDYGINPLQDEDILAYFDLLQVPIDVEQVNLDYFQKVLDRLLA